MVKFLYKAHNYDYYCLKSNKNIKIIVKNNNVIIFTDKKHILDIKVDGNNTIGNKTIDKIFIDFYKEIIKGIFS